jgi:hypothetical protein
MDRTLLNFSPQGTSVFNIRAFLKDFLKLVLFVGSLKKWWATLAEFGNHTTNTPHVNFVAIGGTSKQELGGSVPECNDHARELTVCQRIIPSCQSKVSNLEHTIPTDENIGWLKISVQNIVCMEIVASRK